MSLMKSLLRLYQVDAQVRGLRSRLQSAQRYCSVQESQLQTLEEQRQELLARTRHCQASIANLETETASIDDRIEKLRDELNSAVTNKQYSALLSELNHLKESRSEVEDRELREMETVEQLKEQLAEVEMQETERRKVRDLAAEQLEERQQEVGARLAELEAERAVAASTVPPDHLTVFEQIADAYDGEAMAAVDEIDRRHREYACGACHMTIPFEHVAVLLAGPETLTRCTACQRILYIQDETRGALAKK